VTPTIPPGGGGVSGPGPIAGAGSGGGGGFGVGTPALDPIGGLLDGSFADFGGFGATVEWAVPALALTVPGLLLILAVLSQAVVGAVWLPFVRRWLGGLGVARRRSRARSAA